jgi:hypothetical protein
VNLCLEQLPPAAVAAAETCGIDWPSTNNFQALWRGP